MSVWVSIGVAILCVARGAAAERTIMIDAVRVPFAATELAAAIRIRVPTDGARIEVRVTATERGVRIEAAGGMREVELLGLRGVAAARLVALAVNDLLPDDVAQVPAAASTAPPAPAGDTEAIAVGVVGAMASWSGALGAIALDVTIPRARWLIALELGGGALAGGALHLTAATVRADAGLRAGVLEARAGISAMPVFVTTGAGDATLLLGANASVRARIGLASAVRAIIAVGGDVFATRTIYRIEGMPAFTTPRFAPWFAAGIEVGL